MRTNRIVTVAFVLGWMFSAAIGAAVGSVITGQDKNTQPSCTALSGNRGRLWFNESASGTSDYLQACMVDASGTYSWNAVKSSAFTSTDNALARFDGVTGGLQNGLSTENDAGGVTLSSSLTLTGDANISDDLFVTDDIFVTSDIEVTGDVRADDIKILAAAGNLRVLDSAGNVLATFQDAGTTGIFVSTAYANINGTYVGTGSADVENGAGTSWLDITASYLDLKPIATHGVRLNTSGSKAACAVGNRGSMFYEAGGAGVADIFYVCSKSAADAYAWRDIALVTP